MRKSSGAVQSFPVAKHNDMDFKINNNLESNKRQFKEQMVSQK